MNMLEEETYYSAFWEASKLSKFNLKEFASKLNRYDSDDKEFLLEFPKVGSLLPSKNSKLNKLADRRQSTRVFSGTQLSVKELGVILSSFRAWHGLEHRSYPSAGATYATEIFCVPFHVEKYGKKILYYHPEKHAVVDTGNTAPSWEHAQELLNISVEGQPNVLIVFVSFPERVVAKYGERGGRFALLETGAALQQLALQIAGSSTLKGVIVGGMLDETWKQLLGLERTTAQVVIGYLIGK
jgi:SagB-type dehydrogenase family enzyme